MNRILLITKGIIHGQKMRRSAMFVVTLAALGMLVVGFVVIPEWLRERPLAFLCWWGAVAWFTFTALMLALFDMVAVRIAGRAAERELRQSIFGEEDQAEQSDRANRTDRTDRSD